MLLAFEVVLGVGIDDFSFGHEVQPAGKGKGERNFFFHQQDRHAAQEKAEDVFQNGFLFLFSKPIGQGGCCSNDKSIEKLGKASNLSIFYFFKKYLIFFLTRALGLD
jgi:hypothetical protein